LQAVDLANQHSECSNTVDVNIRPYIATNVKYDESNDIITWSYDPPTDLKGFKLTCRSLSTNSTKTIAWNQTTPPWQHTVNDLFSEDSECCLRAIDTADKESHCANFTINRIPPAPVIRILIDVHVRVN